MDYRLLWILVRLMKDEKVAEAKFRHPHILQCAFCGIFHPLIKMMAEAHGINYFILVAEAKFFLEMFLLPLPLPPIYLRVYWSLV